jgi:hypothetical protein
MNMVYYFASPEIYDALMIANPDGLSEEKAKLVLEQHKEREIAKLSGATTMETGFKEVFSKIMDSEFVNEIKKFAAVCSFSVLGQQVLATLSTSPTLVSLFEYFKSALDAANLIDCMSSLTNSFIESVLPAFANFDLSYLKPSVYKTKLQAICAVDHASTSGFPSDICRSIITQWYGPTPIQEDEYSLRLQLLSVLEEMLIFLQKSASGNTSLVSLNQSVLTARANLRATIKALNRHMPLCVGYTGPPACGKTSFLKDRVPALLLDILGLEPRKFMENGVMKAAPPAPVQVVMQNFQGNIVNSTSVILFDDFHQVFTQPGQSEILKIFWDVQSNAITQVPKAEIDQKSGCFYNNKLTLITANDESFGITGHVHKPEAFKRRVHFHIRASGRTKDREACNFAVDTIIPGTALMSTTEIDPLLSFDQKIRVVEDLLVDYAKLYQEDAAAEAIRARNLACLCVQCYKPMDKCSCNAVIVAINPAAIKLDGGPCMIGPLIADMDDKFLQSLYLGLAAISEECIVRHFDQDAILSIILIRILIDRIAASDRLKWHVCLAYLIITVVSFVNLYLGIFVHFMINMYLYTKAFEAAKHRSMLQCIDFFNRSFVGPHLQIILKSEGPALELNPQFVKKISSFSADVLEKAFVEGVLQRTILSTGGVFVAIIGCIYSTHAFTKWLFTPALLEQFTAIGEPSTEEDVETSRKYDSLVKSGYRGQTNGMAQNWRPAVHQIRGTPDNNTIPSGLYNNFELRVRTRISDTEFGETLKSKAYYNNGRVYFNKHMLKGANVSTILSFTDMKDNKSVDLSYSPAVIYQGIHDLVWVEWSGQKRKTIKCNVSPINKTYTYAISTDLIPTKVLSQSKARAGEPEGCPIFDFISKPGNSGTPYFIIHDGETAIQPMFAGILSRMVVEDGLPNYAVGAPLDDRIFSSIRNLELQVDVQQVRTQFTALGQTLSASTNPKSVLSHIEPHLLHFLGDFCGSLNKHPVQSSTGYKQTHLYHKGLQLCPDAAVFTTPLLRPRIRDGVFISSVLGGVRQMMMASTVTNESAFIAASDVVYDHIYSKVKHDLSSVAPLNVEQVIKGTTHTNPLNLKAGIGFPHSGCKADLVSGTWEHPTFVAWFGKMLIEQIEGIDNGQPVWNISTASIKDEIISQKKVDEGIERMFFAGNSGFLMLCRQYLAPYLDIFTSHRDELFGQIGMNAVGKELHQKVMGMMDKMGVQRGEKAWLDSDFVKYDKVLITLRYGVRVLNRLALDTPFYQENPKELKRIQAILAALQQFIVIIGNDVVLMDKRLPSGVFATAWLNCICEAIIEVLQFYYCLGVVLKGKAPEYEDFVSLLKDEYPFFENVALANFGDDNLKCVAEKVRHIYSHERIMAFSEYIGMGITPARKTEPRIEYKTETEILFLKRTPVWNERQQMLNGRLELSSIARMFCYTDSTDPTWEAMVLDQGLREMAYYPIDEFNRFKEIFGVQGDYETIQDKAMEHTWVSSSDPVKELYVEYNMEYTSEIETSSVSSEVSDDTIESDHPSQASLPESVIVPDWRYSNGSSYRTFVRQHCQHSLLKWYADFTEKGIRPPCPVTEGSIRSTPCFLLSGYFPVRCMVLLVQPADWALPLTKLGELPCELIYGPDCWKEQAGTATPTLKRIQIDSQHQKKNNLPMKYLDLISCDGIPWVICCITSGPPRQQRKPRCDKGITREKHVNQQLHDLARTAQRLNHGLVRLENQVHRVPQPGRAHTANEESSDDDSSTSHQQTTRDHAHSVSQQEWDEFQAFRSAKRQKTQTRTRGIENGEHL